MKVFCDLGKRRVVLSSFPLAGEAKYHDPSMKSFVNVYLLEHREIYQYPSTVEQTENGCILWHRIN